MPAVAVLGGIASAMGGAAAFSAAAGFTLANVAAGLAVVGGVASALGGITGNEKLMKFGMIASLGGAAAGGLGSLMNAGTEAAGAATALSTGETGLGLAQGATEGLSASSSGLGIQMPSGGGMLAELDTGVSRLAQESASSGAIDSIASKAAESAAADPIANYALKAPAATQIPTRSDAVFSNTGIGGTAPSATNVMDDATRVFTGGAASPPPNAKGADASIFSNFGEFIKKNPELVKTGTGMLGGMGQAYMQGQQMKERDRILERDRARLNASIMGQRSTY